MNWDLWKRQAAAILRIEWKKSFFARRAWWIYFLALGPVAITLGHSLHEMSRRVSNCIIGEDSQMYAGIFHMFYLRLGIYFGCVGIFSNLFRSEVLERTLHYYFLAPVRREVVVAGKYLAGLAASTFFFAGGAALSFIFISMHFGQAYQDYILRGPGLEQLVGYVVTAVLACAGYGALFMGAGMLFRNPMIPAAVMMVWEGINGFLPPLLKKISIIFYLQSIAPVQLPVEPGEPGSLLVVPADPAPVWLAVPGLLAVVLAMLALAARQARRLQISYTE